MSRRLAALLLSLAPALAGAQSKPPTVEELLREPVIRDVALSRDGKRLAVVGKFGDKRDVIAIVDTERMTEPAGVRKFAIGQEGMHTPLWVMWANDRRLLIGMQVGVDAFPFVAGRQVQAIDPDGANPVALFSDAPVGARFGLNLSRIVDITPEDPDHIVMAAWNRDRTDLYRVNVNTGVAESIARGRFNTIGWETEDGRAALRYDINRRGTEMSIYGHDAENEDDWSRIAKIRMDEVVKEWEFAGDAAGVGNIFVRARRDGADTRNIYRYDLRTKTTGEIVAQAPGYDMDDAFAIDGEYAGASYVADTTTYLLKDPRLQGHWNAVSRYFKGLANVRIVEIDKDHTKMLLYVVGPQAPGDYYLYDFARTKLELFVTNHPWLEPETLASVEVLKSPMRDGTTITTYLTRPNAAKGPLPLVVLPHGGPERRDAIAFDPLAQAFAAQGWLVLQPNFRGSGGYGKAFAEAGHRQWSKRMQDDVTDAVQDLIKRQIADPEAGRYLWRELRRLCRAHRRHRDTRSLSGGRVSRRRQRSCRFHGLRAAGGRRGCGNLSALATVDRRSESQPGGNRRALAKATGRRNRDTSAADAWHG